MKNKLELCFQLVYFIFKKIRFATLSKGIRHTTTVLKDIECKYENVTFCHCLKQKKLSIMERNSPNRILNGKKLFKSINTVKLFKAEAIRAAKKKIVGGYKSCI